jgi:hypothetical protein
MNWLRSLAVVATLIFVSSAANASFENLADMGEGNSAPQKTQQDTQQKTPQCEAIGTRSEGWYRNGQLLRWDRCLQKIAICERHFADGEGWYAVEQPKLINWSQCENAKSHPVCAAVGTRSEGWYLDGRLLKKFNGAPAITKCAGQVASCYAIGTRSEGWYAFAKPQFLLSEQCLNR